MSHWSESYIGMPYVEGVFDCADLSKRVQREVFGREIALPSTREYTSCVGAAKFEAMTRQIVDCRADYAQRIEGPEEGCAVLLESRTKMNHIGVFCWIDLTAYVLHASRTQKQVILTRVRDLSRYSLSVEGYYQWI